MVCFCTFSKINFVRSPISWRINSTSILAQYGNNRRSFNQSLLFEKKNYSFISWSGINNKQLNMVTFPPRPVDIHGIFFCLHPRRCFRNQPRLSMISGLGSRMFSQRSGGQAQSELSAFNPLLIGIQQLRSAIQICTVNQLQEDNCSIGSESWKACGEQRQWTNGCQFLFLLRQHQQHQPF